MRPSKFQEIPSSWASKLVECGPIARRYAEQVGNRRHGNGARLVSTLRFCSRDDDGSSAATSPRAGRMGDAGSRATVVGTRRLDGPGAMRPQRQNRLTDTALALPSPRCMRTEPDRVCLNREGGLDLRCGMISRVASGGRCRRGAFPMVGTGHGKVRAGGQQPTQHRQNVCHAAKHTFLIVDFADPCPAKSCRTPMSVIWPQLST